MSTDENSKDNANSAVARQKAAETATTPTPTPKPSTTEAAKTAKPSAAPEPAGSAKPAKGKKPPPPRKPAPPPRKGGILAVLAFLLALAALAGTAYQWYLQQQAAKQVQPEVKAWLPDVEQLSAKLESSMDSLGNEIGDARQQAQASSQQLDGEIEKLSRDSVALLSQLSELGRTDRDDWQLAEVEYLLRMAHQRVVMGGELNSAASLLANADNILNDLNMAGLHMVRKQVARDLVAVRAAAELDIEGIYLRLQALQEQASSLPFFGMPLIDAPEHSVPAAAGDDWQSTLDQGWQQAVAKFKTLVVVQKQQGEVKPLLSEAWQKLVRERLALNLAQARNALILQQPAIYQSALDSAQKLVKKHFLADSPSTLTMLADLDILQRETIVPDLPDISGSQEAIRAYIDQKYQAQEQVAPLAEQGAEQ